jgi:hypothetical protein
MDGLEFSLLSISNASTRSDVLLLRMQGDEPTAFVTYERLESKIIELLTTHACDPDTDDTLLQVRKLGEAGDN